MMDERGYELLNKELETQEDYLVFNTSELAEMYGYLYFYRVELADNMDCIDLFYQINTKCLEYNRKLMEHGAYDMFSFTGKWLPCDMKYEYLESFDFGYETAKAGVYNEPLSGDLRHKFGQKSGGIRHHITTWKRQHIFKKYDYTCANCGKKDIYLKTLQIDHITPVKRGGTNAVGNLQVLCKECNLEKGTAI